MRTPRPPAGHGRAQSREFTRTFAGVALAIARRMHRLATTFLWLAAACTSTQSGATCPSTNPPTYASFGHPFMARYCTGCHSSGAKDRHGAPAGLDFDSEAEIRAKAIAIDAEAAAGPDAQNTDMPDLTGPVHAEPTMAERERLGQFLACERR